MLTELVATLVVAPPREFRLVANEQFSYQVKQLFINEKRDEKTEYVYRVDYKVKSVSAGRLGTLDVTRQMTGMFVDGDQVKLPANQLSTVLSEQRNPFGEIRNRRVHPSHPYLLARHTRILDFRYPTQAMRMGLEWETSIPAAENNQVPAAKWSWRVSNVTDKFVGIEFTFSELKSDTAMKGEGTLLLDNVNGWPIAARAEIKNARIPGDELNDSMTLRISWNRNFPKVGG